MAAPSRSAWDVVLVNMVVGAAIVLEVEATVRWFKKPKMSVSIRNQLPGTVTLHCRSRDDDLKQQFLPAGTEYYFRFYLNAWGITDDYWCNFQYGIRWNGFDVWTGSGFWDTDEFPCHQCLWVVAIEGFYRDQEGQKLNIQKPWPQDHH